MLTTLLIASTLCFIQDGGAPEPPGSQPQESKVVQILTAANDAARDVESVRYHAQFHGTGALAARSPVVEGDFVKVLPSDNSVPLLIKCSGWYFATNIGTDAIIEYEASFDGNNALRIEHESETAFVSSSGNPQGPFGPAIRLDMREFGHPTPFQDELNGNVVQLEGQTVVGGVICNVVYVEYSIQPSQKARWYFGVDDNLPRKVERLQNVNGRQAATVLILSELEVDGEWEQSEFELTVPDGYSKQESGGPRMQGGGMPIGR